MRPNFRTIEKHCEVCHQPLVLKNNRDIQRKRFCSKSCFWIGKTHRPRQPDRFCSECGKKLSPSCVGTKCRTCGWPKQPDRFCSECGKKLSYGSSCIGTKCRRCFNKAKANGINVPCEFCGKNIYLDSFRAQFRHSFCSHACHAEWKKLQPSKSSTIFQCLECGQNVERFKSQGQHKFCSYKCNWIWSSKNRRGKNSFAYIDGRTPFRTILKQSARYDEWRIEVFTRDHWQCTECGAGKKLHVHHLVPLRRLLSAFKQAHPTLDFSDQELAMSLALKFAPFWDVSNGKTLCADCHSKQHPNVNLFGKDSRQLSLF